jgi:hypothetical protein
MCTGEPTLAPFFGVQTVIDGVWVLKVQLPDCTFTVADDFELPPWPVAVAVNVVVLVGLIATDPDGPTVPTPGSMSTEVAFVVDHDSVELCPAEMLDGLAVS